MTPDVRTKRLEGDLPAGMRVAHKSGTSDVDTGLAHATADRATREQIIARIARAAYDASLQSTSSSR